MTRHRCFTVILCCLALTATAVLGSSFSTTPRSNNRIHVRPDTITVSGISSGAFFAVQYQTAFSSQIQGAAVVAGGPYLCAMGSIMGTTDCMYSPELLNQQTLIDAVGQSYQEGNIDDPANLQHQTVYLFSGLIDSLVNHGTMVMLSNIYTALNVSNVTTYFDTIAEHAWITSDFGGSCTTLASPYINNCGIDFAGKFLETAFGRMSVNWNAKKATYPATKAYLRSFDQAPFGADPWTNSFANTGYIFVPPQCVGENPKACHLHMSFHGCEQGHYYVGETFVHHSQINQWAIANDIIVLYPQADPNELIGNPDGCFNWWGYNGDGDYAFRTGVQAAIVNRMMMFLIQNGTVPSGGAAPTPGPQPPSPPGPQPPGPPPAPPAPTSYPTSCTNLPWGDSCNSATSILVCPVGMTMDCMPGTTCTGVDGLAMCL